jgi:hypothetical protein
MKKAGLTARLLRSPAVSCSAVRSGSCRNSAERTARRVPSQGSPAAHVRRDCGRTAARPWYGFGSGMQPGGRETSADGPRNGPADVMGFITRRLVGVLIGLTLVLWLPPQPAMAADKLPLQGTLDVTTVGATINIDLAYRTNAPITRFTVSLTGPSFEVVLLETVDALNEVTWSGSRDGLAAGTYTVTVSAEIQRNERLPADRRRGRSTSAAHQRCRRRWRPARASPSSPGSRKHPLPMTCCEIRVPSSTTTFLGHRRLAVPRRDRAALPRRRDVRLQPDLFLPVLAHHPRGHGRLPRQRAVPSSDDARLLHRRREQPVRGQHQPGRRREDHRRMRVGKVLPDRHRHAGADGRLPRAFLPSAADHAGLLH